MSIVLLCICCFAMVMLLGGSAYEYLVVDPCWPARPDLIQPTRGGVSRRRFWIPAHGLFELSLILSLVFNWQMHAVRMPLLIALLSHGVMRVWSFIYFIPKAFVFETATEDQQNAASALRWTRLSLIRLPLDLVTCAFVLYALFTLMTGRN